MTHFVASEFSELLYWADNLVAVMQKRGRDDLVEQIETAPKDLLTNTFTLAVLGKAKRGKSTLINATSNEDYREAKDRFFVTDCSGNSGTGKNLLFYLYYQKFKLFVF
ncbi:MAG: hypothetical protein LBC74_11980 [Planctomycetaceae bacterium]|jgi:predicted GTPase|nr:hypothetical protein [Planctomycetaceae bacterium]